MEIFLESEKVDVNVSTARFANVAFSDGSLPLSMLQRLNSNQPITVPIGVKRFFVTHREAGELCLMSCLLGTDRDIFYPKLTEDRNAVDFFYIAQEILMRASAMVKDEHLVANFHQISRTGAGGHGHGRAGAEQRYFHLSVSR